MRRRRMLATAGTVAAAALGGGTGAAAAAPATHAGSAVLHQTGDGDGWELLSPDDGTVLFEAHGRAARTLCLSKARELGTLRILS